MEWVAALNRTIDFIEGHLTSRISAKDCAREAGISEFYLQRGFRIITGLSLGEYIRNRRLYCAALEIINSQRSILDIALNWQYDTAESFTKAFSRFHGATPSQVRAAGRSSRLITSFLPVHISIQVTGGGKMEYEIAELEGFTVVGFEREFSFTDSYQKIPEFWDEISRKHLERVYAGQNASTPEERAVVENNIGEFGVCIDDTGDGTFRYLIAGKYEGGAVPNGMKLFDIPGGIWAKFRATGALPSALQDVNTRVFKEWLPANPEWETIGLCTVEWYSKGDPDSDSYKSEVWLPVKKRK